MTPQTQEPIVGFPQLFTLRDSEKPKLLYGDNDVTVAADLAWTREELKRVKDNFTEVGFRGSAAAAGIPLDVAASGSKSSSESRTSGKQTVNFAAKGTYVLVTLLLEESRKLGALVVNPDLATEV